MQPRKKSEKRSLLGLLVHTFVHILFSDMRIETKIVKAFKKGDTVTVIGNWDSKGTVSYRHCVVHSCGLKRLVLIDAVTDQCVGRDFRPKKAKSLIDVIEDTSHIHFGEFTFARLSEDEIKSIVIPFAEHILVLEKKDIERDLLDDTNHPSRVRGLESRLAALHEPRAYNRTGSNYSV